MTEQEHIKARNLYARMIMSQADYTCTPVVEYDSAEAQEPEIYYEHKFSFDNSSPESVALQRIPHPLFPGRFLPIVLPVSNESSPRRESRRKHNRKVKRG